MASGLNRDRADARSEVGALDHDATAQPAERSTAEPASAGQSRPSVPELATFSVLFGVYVAALTALGVARGGRWLGRQARSML